MTALNPKGIIFFVAFLPQFMSRAQPVLPQMIILGATFLVLATTNAAVYSLISSMARSSIRSPSAQRALNRVGGTLMIITGALAAGWKRGIGIKPQKQATVR